MVVYLVVYVGTNSFNVYLPFDPTMKALAGPALDPDHIHTHPELPDTGTGLVLCVPYY